MSSASLDEYLKGDGAENFTEDLSNLLYRQ